MRKIKFSIDGNLDMPIYEAVEVSLQRWNGWLIPTVTLNTAEQIAKDIFSPEDNDDNEPSAYHDVKNVITKAKENNKETVDVGCGICWDTII